MHDRVADDHDLDDGVTGAVRRGAPARRRARRAPRARPLVSSVSPPGFIITYDTRLIRSSPKRICGFIRPGRGQHLASGQVAQVAGDGGRSDVDRDADDAVAVAGPDGHDHAVAHRHRRRAAGDGSVGPAQHRGAEHGDGDVVLDSQRRDQLLGHAGDVGAELGRRQLDVVRRHQRVDDERSAGRGPCARPGGAPGSPAGTSMTTSPAIRAAQPSRLPRARGRATVVVGLERARRARAPGRRS